MRISLNAAVALAEGLALCAALSIDHAAGIPEWVHLLPAGEITTYDGRGPYTADLQQLARSFPAGERLVLDENHSTDLAAPNGLPAPAMGWLVALEARDTGLWGKVDWTDAGKALVAAKAYRGISPVLQIEKSSGRIAALLRASLVNRPNIKDLVSLNQESDMDLLKKLISALKLKDGTSEETLITAVTALHQAQTDNATALQSIAGAAGIKAGDTVTSETVLNAVKQLKTAAPAATAVTELQAELATVTTELNALKSSGARDKATAFVDGAIKEGRVGVKPLRDHYIERHMAKPADVEKEIAAFPMLSGTTIVPAKTGDATTSLNAEESEVARQLGIDPKKFAAMRDGVAATA